MEDCIFCKIAAKEIKADVIFEDDEVIAFNDIYPKYPVHVIVIPKKHIKSAAEAQIDDEKLIGHVMRVGAQLAKDKELSERGFRLLTNVGSDAGQTVHHIHFHVLGGEPLRPL